MLAKLAAVILTIGGVAGTLLAARQQRLHAVNESAQAMRRIADHDRTLWRLRGEIAERVTPGKVRRLADRLGPLAYSYGEHFAGAPAARNATGPGIRPAADKRNGAPDADARRADGEEEQQ